MSTNNSILTKYICTNPFKYTEITVNSQHMCCNEWMNLDLETGKGLYENWTGEKAKKARESMISGTFKFCDGTKCPHLNRVLHTDEPSGPIVLKTDDIVLDLQKSELPNSLKIVFDSACNLACPSCRVDFIKNSPEIYKRSNEILSQMDEHYSNSLETISLSGYGDPFYSDALFEWLCSLNSSKYPNLKNIHLHTNAILWNRRNWDKLEAIHPYINSAEISIDAATPETYKVVRKGGNWDLLIRNLKMISELKTFDFLNFSFVIQNENYKEVNQFYDLIKSIFKNTKNIYFIYYKILNWGVLSEEDFNKSAVWKPNHNNYLDLVQEIKALESKEDSRIIHNLHDILNNE